MLLHFTEKMFDAQKIVREHLKQEQQKQNTWYGKKAQELILKEGDQVLLLLPDNSARFTRKLKGPFKAQNKLGRANYETEMENNNTKTYRNSANFVVKNFHSRCRVQKLNTRNIFQPT